MKAWALLLLVFALLYQQAEGKRFDHTFADSLMRRSPLDKNFMRFGRSSPSYTAQDELPPGDSHVSLADADASKEDLLRVIRGRDNFIRFGRGKNENFMRFGRGKQDNFMRFGRNNALDFDYGNEKSDEDYVKDTDDATPRVIRKPDSFIRFGRGKQDNFMRFGRGKQDNFMRFGRGKQDNFMRFGRGKQDNFMRFGRGKQDNFMRFGRGKQDNFMRFGRGKQDNFMRFGRGKQDNSLRFGGEGQEILKSSSVDSLVGVDPFIIYSNDNKDDKLKRFSGFSKQNLENSLPIAMRSDKTSDQGYHARNNKQDLLIPYIKTDTVQTSLTSDPPEYLRNNPYLHFDSSTPIIDTFTRIAKSKDENLLRLGRQPPTKDDSFMRFGRSSLQNPATLLTRNDEIKQLKTHDGKRPETEDANDLLRRKRSTVQLYEIRDDNYPSKIQERIREDILVPISSLTDLVDEEFYTLDQPEDYTTKKKRSLPFESPTLPPNTEAPVDDDVTSKYIMNNRPKFPISPRRLTSPGFPNLIAGPEFSLLPDLDPPPSMLKSSRPSDQSFIRLG